MPHASDEREILQLFEEGDRVLISADVAALRRIYSDDYVQADEHGNLSSREQVIERLSSGRIRFLSMASTGRRIRMLSEDVAIVHGSEEDEVEESRQRASVRYLYMDVVMKREGRWQIVASQLVRC